MQTMTPQATIQNIYGHIALYLYVQKQVFQFQLMVTIMINFFSYVTAYVAREG